jgi:hypothetical protein
MVCTAAHILVVQPRPHATTRATQLAREGVDRRERANPTMETEGCTYIVQEQPHTRFNQGA